MNTLELDASAKLVTRNHEWFDDARLGLFIHWGLYSILARGEWVMFNEKIPKENYNQLANEFCPPESFSPESWVLLAKKAGAGYAVFTTRHHDGFALFNSRISSFNSMQTAAGRDFVREFVAACRKHGLRVGLYYSIMDWQFKASINGSEKDPFGWEAMVSQTHGQLRELMSNYGPIDMLWYDGCCTPGASGEPSIHREFWRTPELNAMVRSLQPDILINDRAALTEDFDTPEQNIAPPPPPRRWEACMTINSSWGFNKSDLNFKSTDKLKRMLVSCASRGGNLLLNIGPTADGSVQPQTVERLQELGSWLKINREAISNSVRTPFSEHLHALGPATTSRNKAYFFLFDFKSGRARLAGFAASDAKASIVGGKQLPCICTDNCCEISDLEGTEGSVIRVEMKDGCLSMNPAKILGASLDIGEQKSEAPILCLNPNLFLQDEAPILPSIAILKMLEAGHGLKTAPSETWTPGWRVPDLICSFSGHLELIIDASAIGIYDLEIGFVSKKLNTISTCVDDAFSDIMPGYAMHPDTMHLKGLKLGKGRHSLMMRSVSDFAVYAMRLNPVWRPIPSELWDTIGPFPTEFGLQKPVSCVKEAMLKRFPPEDGFNTEDEYTGSKGKPVRWSWNPLRKGDHSDCGVNFPFRYGMDPGGISYARTLIESPEDMDISAVLGCDWWCNLFVNGDLVRTTRDPSTDGAYFSGWKPSPVTLRLRKGANEILVKCHKGSIMHWFTFRVNDPGCLTIISELAEDGMILNNIAVGGTVLI